MRSILSLQGINNHFLIIILIAQIECAVGLVFSVSNCRSKDRGLYIFLDRIADFLGNSVIPIRLDHLLNNERPRCDVRGLCNLSCQRGAWNTELSLILVMRESSQ